MDECSRLGLNPETSITFGWLEADKRTSFRRASVQNILLSAAT